MFQGFAGQTFGIIGALLQVVFRRAQFHLFNVVVRLAYTLGFGINDDDFLSLKYLFCAMLAADGHQGTPPGMDAYPDYCGLHLIHLTPEFNRFETQPQGQLHLSGIENGPSAFRTLGSTNLPGSVALPNSLAR
jgi:hypothetical protein